MAPLRIPAPVLCLGVAALVVGCSQDNAENVFPSIPAGDVTGYPSNDSTRPDDGGDDDGDDDGFDFETTTEDPPETTDGDGSESDSDTTDGDTNGGLDDPDQGDFMGVCVGLDVLGFVATIGSRNESNVGGSCFDKPDACGGDLVGAWDIRSNCGNENTPNVWEAFCPGSVRDVRSADTVGTLRFGENDEFFQSTATTYEERITIDAAGCFAGTCADLEAGLPTQPGTTASCSGTDDACTCDLVYTTSIALEGRYVVEGDNVLVTVGENTTPMPFCVDRDRLDLWVGQVQPTFTPTECFHDTHCAEQLGDAHDDYWCKPTADVSPVPGPFIEGPPWSPGAG